MGCRGEGRVGVGVYFCLVPLLIDSGISTSDGLEGCKGAPVRGNLEQQRTDVVPKQEVPVVDAERLKDMVQGQRKSHYFVCVARCLTVHVVPRVDPGLPQGVVAARARFIVACGSWARA